MFYGENQHRQKIGNVWSHSVHAEINALYKWVKSTRQHPRKRTRDLRSASPHERLSIYVVRIMNTTNNKSHMFPFLLGNCRPCINCQSYLSRHGVRVIKYTDVRDNVNVLCEMRRR